MLHSMHLLFLPFLFARAGSPLPCPSPSLFLARSLSLYLFLSLSLSLSGMHGVDCQAFTAMLLIDPSMSALYINAMQKPQSVESRLHMNCECMAYHSFGVRGVQLEVSELLVLGKLACGSQAFTALLLIDSLVVGSSYYCDAL